MAPYVAAKHAVAGLTKAAALDYATQGIRVNAIAPVLVRTPMTERWLNDPEIRERVLADSPIRRPAEPEEIADLVMFLASDQAGVITGAVYPKTVLGPPTRRQSSPNDLLARPHWAAIGGSVRALT